MTQVRILLVDDSPQFLESAASYLAHDPRIAVVGKAGDGREGVRFATAMKPDIVLLDLVMPVMDGIEATRRIKASPAPPRVLIVSMYDDPGIRRSAAAAGADAFIPKDRFVELVSAEIDRYCGVPGNAETSR